MDIRTGLIMIGVHVGAGVPTRVLTASTWGRSGPGAASRAAATVDMRVGRVDLVSSPVGGRPVRVRCPAAGMRTARAGFRLGAALAGLAPAALVAAAADQVVVSAVAGLLALHWAFVILRATAELVVPARFTAPDARIVPVNIFGNNAETAGQLHAMYKFTSRQRRRTDRRPSRPGPNRAPRRR